MPIDFNLIKELGSLLGKRNMTVSTAESCTAGGLAYALTSLSGSSSLFDRAYVTYSNQAKHDMLKIPLAFIEKYDPVSEEVALQMATSALNLSHSFWAIAITGIAGPDGGTPQNPVGTVWIALANQQGLIQAKKYLFKGPREIVREESINASLTDILHHLRVQSQD